jgi:hypothetical protein
MSGHHSFGTIILFGGAGILVAALQGCTREPETVEASDTSSLVSTVHVLTQHNDFNRTGANTEEKILTTTSVTPQSFGKLFQVPVDGQVYAQPLFVGGVRGKNVVYVATEHNSVYAFDADQGGAPIWSVNLGSSMPSQDTGGCGLLSPEIGITSTPVINLAAQTIFVSAKTKENGAYFYRLHALDLATGAEKTNSPVTITASVRGSGDGSSGGTITFDPKKHLNRPGLLLAGGKVVIAFGSNCDISPYHGWVMSYDEATLVQSAVFVDTPDGSQGGIWQGGVGLATDTAGNVYFVGGNGTFDGQTNLGGSIVKLGPSTNALTVASWFAPGNIDALSQQDLDIGGTGALLVPGTNLLVTGGKQGFFYVVNRDAMGGQTQTDGQIVQKFQATSAQAWGGPAYWARGANPMMYVWGQGDNLKAYRFNGTTFDGAPTVNTRTSTKGFPGGQLALSSNGDTPGTGIVWATHPNPNVPTFATGAGFIAAFNAEDITQQLWSSDTNARDTLGVVAKFAAPTIVNGHVYVGTLSGNLVVYGLLGASGNGDAGTDSAQDAQDAALDAADVTSTIPPTWTALYTNFFGPGTPGHCGNSGCHSGPQPQAGFSCGATKATCYAGMVSFGLVNPSAPASSRLGDPGSSPLAWFNGIMPFDNPSPNPAGAAAITAWLAAGAPNN